MPVATYSRNPVVETSVAVNSTATSGTIYTCPASSYAKIQATLFSGVYGTSGTTYIVVGTSATSGSLYVVSLTGSTVGSNIPGAYDTNSTLTAISDGALATVDITVGPSESVYIVRNTSGGLTTTGRVMLSGVEFKNG